MGGAQLRQGDADPDSRAQQAASNRRRHKDIDNNNIYWVDVIKIHEMNKTNQETESVGTSPAIHACNTRISTKTGVHHAEAAAHNATLVPFVVGSHRVFYPLDKSSSEEDT